METTDLNTYAKSQLKTYYGSGIMSKTTKWMMTVDIKNFI